MKETSIRDAKSRLTSLLPRANFTEFLQSWRGEMIAKGVPFITDEELVTMRDRTPAREFSLDE